MKYIGRISKTRYYYFTAERKIENEEIVELSGSIKEDYVEALRNNGEAEQAEIVENDVSEGRENKIILYNNFRVANEFFDLCRDENREVCLELNPIHEMLQLTETGNTICTVKDYTNVDAVTLEQEFSLQNIDIEEIVDTFDVGAEVTIDRYVLDNATDLSDLFNRDNGIYKALTRKLWGWEHPEGDADRLTNAEIAYELYKVFPRFGRYDRMDRHNYEDGLDQACYILKYGYAYTYLYYKMYYDLFTNKFTNTDEDIKVLSIGCGTKIDLLGLKMAYADLGMNNRVSYHGIDITDWTQNHYCVCNDGRYDSYTPDEEAGVPGGAVSFLEELETNDFNYNVVIFPYSMNEIVAYDGANNLVNWERICELLPEKIGDKNVIIMTNLNESQYGIDTDSFQRLLNQFGNHSTVANVDNRENGSKIWDNDHIGMDLKTLLLLDSKIDYLKIRSTRYGTQECEDHIDDICQYRQRAIDDGCDPNKIEYISLNMTTGMKYINYWIEEINGQD